MHTDAEITVLSLIAESPSTLSSLQKRVQSRGLDEWFLIGNASLQTVLDSLCAHGMADLILAEESVYGATEAGRGVLHTAISDLLCQAELSASPFETAIANLSALKPAQVADCMKQRLSSLMLRLEAADARLKAQNVSDMQRQLLTRSQAMAQADFDWTTGFLSEWLTRYPALNAGTMDAVDESTRPTLIHRPTRPVNPAKQIQHIQRSHRPD